MSAGMVGPFRMRLPVKIQDRLSSIREFPILRRLMPAQVPMAALSSIDLSVGESPFPDSSSFVEIGNSDLVASDYVDVLVPLYLQPTHRSGERLYQYVGHHLRNLVQEMQRKTRDLFSISIQDFFRLPEPFILVTPDGGLLNGGIFAFSASGGDTTVNDTPRAQELQTHKRAFRAALETYHRNRETRYSAKRIHLIKAIYETMEALTDHPHGVPAINETFFGTDRGKTVPKEAHDRIYGILDEVRKILGVTVSLEFNDMGRITSLQFIETLGEVGVPVVKEIVQKGAIGITQALEWIQRVTADGERAFVEVHLANGGRITRDTEGHWTFYLRHSADLNRLFDTILHQEQSDIHIGGLPDGVTHSVIFDNADAVWMVNNIMLFALENRLYFDYSRNLKERQWVVHIRKLKDDEKQNDHNFAAPMALALSEHVIGRIEKMYQAGPIDSDV